MILEQSSIDSKDSSNVTQLRIAHDDCCKDGAIVMREIADICEQADLKVCHDDRVSMNSRSQPEGQKDQG